MSDFLIAYDLVAGDEDEYPDLWNALKLLKAYPIQKSVWRLSGDYTCKDLLDRLRNCLSRADGDRIKIVRFDQSAGFNSMKRGG